MTILSESNKYFAFAPADGPPLPCGATMIFGESHIPFANTSTSAETGRPGNGLSITMRCPAVRVGGTASVPEGYKTTLAKRDFNVAAVIALPTNPAITSTSVATPNLAASPKPRFFRLRYLLVHFSYSLPATNLTYFMREIRCL